MNSKGTSNDLFTPLKSTRAFEEISFEIKKLVFKGVLKPGDKLPSETELARQFNVGRHTIREALRILELSGFITIQKGSSGGPVIQDTILNTISNSFIDSFFMKKITTDELAVARLEAEKMMLGYVIRNADEEDIKSLQNNIIQAKRHMEANIQPFRDNIEFHMLLAKASKNQVFVIIVESIMAIIADFFSRVVPSFEVSKKVTIKHEEILDAIIRKDHDRATALLEEDILEVGQRFEKTIDKVHL